MTQPFDVIIAGGGMAGCLAAARLRALCPGVSLKLIEKEPFLGGRARASRAKDETRAAVRGYGLNRLTPEAFELLAQTLKLNPEAPDLLDLAPRREERMGILAANEISEFAASEFFGLPAVKALGGMAAVREWKEHESYFSRLIDGDASETAIGQSFPAPKKGAIAAVLEAWSGYLGIADLWHAAGPALIARANAAASRRHLADWEKILAQLVSPSASDDAPKGTIETALGGTLLGANFENDQWTIKTDTGTIHSRALLVAMPPWSAITWLPKTLWPQAPLQMTLRMRPVTAVVLSETATKPLDLPETLFVPAEGVQILSHPETREITFQATLDYEMSLQAPNVVKAVRSLKRARKRLTQIFPESLSEGDHLAIIPGAWTQSTAQADRKMVERMGKGDYQDAHLAFCGDAYGPSWDGDANLTRSVLEATQKIATTFQRG
jgi:glycine/D-amino acid oxidase-like deaminating enzyme